MHVFSCCAKRQHSGYCGLTAVVSASQLRLFPLLPIESRVTELLQRLCWKGDLLFADGFVGRPRLGSGQPERPSGIFVNSCNTSEDLSHMLHNGRKKGLSFTMLTNLVPQL